MQTAERGAEILASRAEIWRYLADFTNSAAWDPSIVSVHRVAGDGTAGTLYRGRRRWDGKEFDVTYRVEECRSESFLRISGHTDCFISDLRVQLGDGKTVDISITEDVAAVLNVSHRFPRGVFDEQNNALAFSLSAALVAL